MKRLLVNMLLLLSLSLGVGTAASSTHPARVLDETGREVTIPSSPRRIISLAPNITEILFALGLGNELVGVSINCNYPEAAKLKPRVGSYISLDFEKILSLRPDLILATGAGNTLEMVDRLEKLGFPTYVIFPKNFDDVRTSIRHVGQILNREKEAREIISNMEARKERVVGLTRGLPRPRVFLQIGEAPIVTVGRGSFADDLIRLAGGENIAANDGKMYPRLALEEILRRAPEVIIISSMNFRGDYQNLLQEWARWKTIPAVQNGRISLIDSDLIDRPSPRIIDGLEEMARIIHPEKFKK
jgi:iron complex transport system substrate-binding protein